MKLTKRNSNYILDYYKDGKRVRTSLKTNDLKTARVRAEELLRLPQKAINRSLLRDYILDFERLRFDLKHNLRIVEDRLGHLRIDQVSLADYVAFEQYIKANYQSPSTRNKKLLTLQLFIKYLLSLGLAVEQVKYRLERQVQAKHFIYTPEQIDQLRVDPVMGDLILVLYHTGMRLSEALNLKAEDITDNFIHLYKTKSGKARSIPIHDAISEAVIRLINAPKLTVYGYENQFRRLRKQLNLPVNARLHDLRHTFATNLCEKGVSVDVVSKLLGHSNIQTTLIYARVSDRRLSQAIKLL
jgi:integrase